MSAAHPRFLKKFTSSDGSTYTYTFPTGLYEVSSEQGLRTTMTPVAGASYPFDQLGLAPAPKDAQILTHHFVIANSTGAATDTAFDTLRSQLRLAGLGKLYTVDENGANERWAWARLANMPSTAWTVGTGGVLAIALSWLVISDFVNSTGYDTTFTVNADPKTVTVTNPGNAKVYDAILILKGTFTNPSITNSTNGYSLSTTRDGSAGTHWLEIRAGRPSVRFSTDSGVTYAGDFALVTLPTSQIQLMVLEPGNNSIVVTGGNGSTLTVQFSPPWE